MARPLNRIIVHSASDMERELIAFLLRTRLRCHVTETSTREKLVLCLGADNVRCVVVVHEGRSGDSMKITDLALQSIDEDYPEVPVLLLDLPSVFTGDCFADRRIAGVAQPPEIIEAVRVLWQRKRGPRPLSWTAVKAQKLAVGRLSKDFEPASRIERMITLSEQSSPVERRA